MPWPLNHVQAVSKTIRPFSPGNAARAGAQPAITSVTATTTARPARRDVLRNEIANDDIKVLVTRSFRDTVVHSSSDINARPPSVLVTYEQA